MSPCKERFRPYVPRGLVLDLLEGCWWMRSPSGRLLSCGIYRTDAGIEVRCAYGADHLFRSELVRDLRGGRTVAETWRLEVLDTRGFEEITRVARRSQ